MKHISSRTKQHEVWLIIMRLLSVLMSRTKSSSKTGSEVTKIVNFVKTWGLGSEIFSINCGSNTGLHRFCFTLLSDWPFKRMLSRSLAFSPKAEGGHVHLFLSKFSEIGEFFLPKLEDLNRQPSDPFYICAWLFSTVLIQQLRQKCNLSNV